MELKELKPRLALNKAFLKVKPNRTEIDSFKANLLTLLNGTNDKESEEFHKNLVSDFLKKTYYDPNHFINTKGRNDLVIHNKNTAKTSVGVIIEAKKPTNKSEMMTTQKLNTKALQELVLYYLRERITHNNLEIKHLIATNINEWFVFDAKLFEELFAQNKNFVKQFNDFENKQLVGIKTEFFYNDIAKPFIEQITTEIQFTYFNIQDYKEILENQSSKGDNALIALFKLLSPEHLLKLPFTNDSNSLDKRFYSELLHIIGLTETKDGGKKLIQRNKLNERHSGTILEDAIVQLDSLDKLSRLEKPQQFGANTQERLFNVALELSITWINRILFLKLLEAQLLKYHKNDTSYLFLNLDKIKNYNDLNSLFFQVLARKYEDRNNNVKDIFQKVPYLNSSLFEPTELEQVSLFMSNLSTDQNIPVIANTVLKDQQGKKQTGNLSTLEYLFAFLNAYDFGAEGKEEIQEDNKTLINASVLGLIFEKINGYKDGAFFTPGFITMYMCRETIRKAVVQKFNEYLDLTGFEKLQGLKNIEEISELIPSKISRKQANQIINSIKICDPAVGSGHFLVSALNEMVAIKNDLNALEDSAGKSLRRYQIEVINDELTITDEDGEFFNYNPKNVEDQRVQETLFHEKQTIIENCLFGVDINPNSVKICRLRLWIELLKNAYYKNPSTLTHKGGTETKTAPFKVGGQLETLPNIDINIKCGDSLVSRFAIDADLKQALKKSKWTIDAYKIAVSTYRNSTNREEKREMERLMVDIKADFGGEFNKNSKQQKELDKIGNELYTKYVTERIFDQKFSLEQQKDKKILERKIENLKTEIEEIKNNKVFENAFEWRFEFPEVLNDDGDFMGFDVIIGNPPYIQLQSMKEISEQLKQFDYQTYDKAGDIYSLFYEKGNNLLKNEGYLAYITSNKWMRAGYGANTRNYFLENTQPELLVDLGGGVFDEATVDANILIFRKTNNQESFQAFDVSKEKNVTDLKVFHDKILTISPQINENWIISNDLEQNIQTKIENIGKPLKDWEVTIYRGILTGYNEAFIIDGKKKNELIAQDPKSAEIIKPVLRGRDIKKYQAKFADLWLINAHNGELVTIKKKKYVDFEKTRIFRNKVWEKVTNLELTKYSTKYRINRVNVERDYPAIYAHLQQFETQLVERGDKGNHWTNLRNCVYYQEFEKEKIIYPETTLQSSFFYDRNGSFIDKTAFFLVGKNSSYLIAIFNSKFFQWTFKNLFSSAVLGENGFQFNKHALEKYPIPDISKKEQKPFIVLVEQILSKKEQNEDTTALEAEIDVLVYALYGLTEEEINIIEKK